MADGRVSLEGCDASYHILRPEDAFHRAFHHAEFDITELSFSRFMARYSEDNVAYEEVPVFPSRAFRHGALFVRTDRGIETPEDLKGKTLGLFDFEMTAALVARGMLTDDHNIAPGDISWVVGAVEDNRGHIPQGDTKTRVAGVEITNVPDGRSLNWRSTEQDYFRRTGIFPIMHAVAIRKSLLAENPWIASSVYKAFCDAKDIAISELQVPQASKVTLPWVVAEYAATEKIMNGDVWPYGFAANRSVIEAMIRWSQNDGLLARPLTADELFVPELLDT